MADFIGNYDGVLKSMPFNPFNACNYGLGDPWHYDTYLGVCANVRDGSSISNDEVMRKVSATAVTTLSQPAPKPEPPAEKIQFSIDDYIPDALKGYIPKALKDNPGAIAVLFIIILYLILRR